MSSSSASQSAASISQPTSSSASCRRHLRILALLSLLVLANIRTAAAKPALPGSPAIIDVPFQLDDGQTGELILEPVDELPGGQQSYWVLPERRTPAATGGGLNGQKRGSLGPRPLRFGRR